MVLDSQLSFKICFFRLFFLWIMRTSIFVIQSVPFDKFSSAKALIPGRVEFECYYSCEFFYKCVYFINVSILPLIFRKTDSSLIFYSYSEFDFKLF